MSTHHQRGEACQGISAKKKPAIKMMKNISNGMLNVLAESQQPSFG
jgi:hypothetical protein